MGGNWGECLPRNVVHCNKNSDCDNGFGNQTCKQYLEGGRKTCRPKTACSSRTDCSAEEYCAADDSCQTQSEAVLGGFDYSIMNPEFLQKIILFLRQNERDKLKPKLKKLLKDPTQTTEDVFNFMEKQLSDEDKTKIEKLLAKNITKEEIIKLFIDVEFDDRKKVQDYKEDLKLKIQNLLEEQNTTTVDVFNLLKDELGIKDQTKIDLDIVQGVTMKEIISEFLKGEFDEVIVEPEVSILVDEIVRSRNLTEEQLLELLKTSLGKDSQEKLETCLESGRSPAYCIEYFLEHGKTEDEEETILTKKKEIVEHIKEVVKDPKKSTDDIFQDLLKKLDKEDLNKLDTLFIMGLSKDKIIKYFALDDKEAGKKKELVKIKGEIEVLKIVSSNEDIFDTLLMLLCQSNITSKASSNETETNTTTIITRLYGNRNMNGSLTNQTVDLCEEDKTVKLDELLEKGIPKEEIIDKFLKGELDSKESLQKEKDDLKLEIKKVLEEKTIEDVFKELKKKLKPVEIIKINILIGKGMTKEQVIDQFLTGGFDEYIEEPEFPKKIKELVSGKNVTDEQILDVMKGVLGNKSKSNLEEMMAVPQMTIEYCIFHCMGNGKTEDEEKEEKQKKKDDLKIKLKNIVKYQNATNETVFETLREKLSEEDKDKINEMLESGVPKEKIVKDFLNCGLDDKVSVQISKNKLKDKLRFFLKDPAAKTGSIFSLMKDELRPCDKEKIEAMIERGMAKDKIIINFINGGIDEILEESMISNKMEEVLEGRNLTDNEVLEILKGQLGPDSRKELEDMINSGLPVKYLIEYFLEHGNTEEEEQEEAADRTMTREIIKIIQTADNSTTKEIFEILLDNLNKAEKKNVDDMLKLGMTKNEILKYFVVNEKTQNKKDELKKELKDLLDNSTNTIEVTYDILLSKLCDNTSISTSSATTPASSATAPASSDTTPASSATIPSSSATNPASSATTPASSNTSLCDDRTRIEELLEKGMPKDEIIKYFIDGGLDDKEAVQKAKIDLKLKIQKLLEDLKVTPEEILNVLKSNLLPDDQKRVEEMIEKGITIEKIINLFMEGKLDEVLESEFSDKINDVIQSQNLTNVQILEVMKTELGEDSKVELTKMLETNMSLTYVLEYFKEYGKTEEEERAEEAKRNKEEIVKAKNITGNILEALESGNWFTKKGVGQCGNNKDCVLGNRVETVCMEENDQGKCVRPEETLPSCAPKELGDAVYRCVLPIFCSSDKNCVNSKCKRYVEGGSKTCQSHPDACTVVCSPDEFCDETNVCIPESRFDRQKEREKLKTKLKALLKEPDESIADIFDLMKKQLTPNDKTKIEELVEKGLTKSEIIKLFVNGNLNDHEEVQKAKEKLKEKIQELLEDPVNLIQEITNTLQEELGPEDQQIVEEIIAKGKPLEEVIDEFLEGELVPARIVEETPLAKKMQKLTNGTNLNNTEVLDLIIDQVGDDTAAEIEEMLEVGMTEAFCIEHCLGGEGKTEEEEEKEKAKKQDIKDNIKTLVKNPNSNTEDIFVALQEIVSPSEQEEIDNLLDIGLSKEAIVKHFTIDEEREKREEEKIPIKKKIPELMLNPNKTTEEIFDTFLGLLCTNKTQNNLTSRVQRLRSARNLTNSEQCQTNQDCEALDQGYPICKERNGTKTCMTASHCLSHCLNTEFCDSRHICTSSEPYRMCNKEKTKIQEIIESGTPQTEVIALFLSGELDDKEALQKVKDKIKITSNNLIEEAPIDEVLNLLTDQLAVEDNNKIVTMLEIGMTKENIVNQFLEGRIDEIVEEPEFPKKMKELIGRKILSPTQILDLMKSILGPASEENLEECLQQPSMNKSYCIQDCMENGKTEEEEELLIQIERYELKIKLIDLNNSTNSTTDIVFVVLLNDIPQKDLVQIIELLKEDIPREDIIQLVLTGALDNKKAIQKGKEKCKAKLKKLLRDPSLNSEEIFTVLIKCLGLKDRENITIQLAEGIPKPIIIKLFIKGGIDENIDDSPFAELIKELMDEKNLTQPQTLDLIKSQLGPNSTEAIENILATGMPIEYTVDYFLEYGKTEEEEREEQEEKIKYKMKDLLNDPIIRIEDIFEILKNSLKEEDRKKLEELLEIGKTKLEIIRFFIVLFDEDKHKIHGERERIEDNIKELVKDQTLSPEQVFATVMTLICNITSETPCQTNQDCEITDQPNPVCKERNGTKTCISESHCLSHCSSIEFCNSRHLCKTNPRLGNNQLQILCREDRAKIHAMLQKGISKTEIVTLILSGELDDEEVIQQIKDDLKIKLHIILRNASTTSKTPVEIAFSILTETLGPEDNIRIEGMQAKGLTKEKIIKQFLGGTLDNVEKVSKIPQKVKELVSGRNITDEDILEVIKSQLGENSREQLEEMLQFGLEVKIAIYYFMEFGKLEEEEQAEEQVQLEELKKRIQNKINQNSTTDTIFEVVLKNLPKVDLKKVKEMLKRGMLKNEIIYLILGGGLDNRNLEKLQLLMESLDQCGTNRDCEITDQANPVCKRRNGRMACMSVSHCLSHCETTEFCDSRHLCKANQVCSSQEDCSEDESCKQLVPNGSRICLKKVVFVSLYADHCATNKDCELKENKNVVCKEANGQRTCVDQSECFSHCQSWEMCNSRHQCEAPIDRCGTNRDCALHNDDLVVCKESFRKRSCVLEKDCLSHCTLDSFCGSQHQCQTPTGCTSKHNCTERESCMQHVLGGLKTCHEDLGLILQGRDQCGVNMDCEMLGVETSVCKESHGKRMCVLPDHCISHCTSNELCDARELCQVPRRCTAREDCNKKETCKQHVHQGPQTCHAETDQFFLGVDQCGTSQDCEMQETVKTTCKETNGKRICVDPMHCLAHCQGSEFCDSKHKCLAPKVCTSNSNCRNQETCMQHVPLGQKTCHEEPGLLPCGTNNDCELQENAVNKPVCKEARGRKSCVSVSHCFSHCSEGEFCTSRHLCQLAVSCNNNRDCEDYELCKQHVPGGKKTCHTPLYPEKIQLGFLIDETCSQEDSAELINSIARDIVGKAQVMADRIKQYILVTVNDVSYQTERNVAFRLATPIYTEFLDALQRVK